MWQWVRRLSSRCSLLDALILLQPCISKVLMPKICGPWFRLLRITLWLPLPLNNDSENDSSATVNSSGILKTSESLASDVCKDVCKDVCTGQAIVREWNIHFLHFHSSSFIDLKLLTFQTQFSTTVRICIFFSFVKIILVFPPCCSDSLNTPVQSFFPNWF